MTVLKKILYTGLSICGHLDLIIDPNTLLFSSLGLAPTSHLDPDPGPHDPGGLCCYHFLCTQEERKLGML